MWQNKIASLFIATTALCLCACSDDDKTPADADDNFITALSLTKDGVKYDAVIEGNDIVMTVPYIVNLNGATADLVYTPSAKIIPNPTLVTDWDNDMVFRVTSFNGEANEYTYKVVKSEIESKGDIILKTQADVDAFAETNVSVIKGNLIIGDNAENATPISNLTALSGVKEISGALQILDNYKGEALDGLAFTKVGGIQFGTKNAESKCADTYRFRLESLQEVAGDIQIHNSKVQFIEFDNLTNVTGNVYIKGDAVTTMTFPKLSVIEGDFDLQDNIEMPLAQFSMPSLESVTGCFSMIKSDNLESIILPKLITAGTIDFNPGYGLNTLSIPEVTDVHGNLSLISKFNQVAWNEFGNKKLLNIDGLSKLKTVEGTLTIACWYGLEEFPNLHNVTLLGGLDIYGLQALASELADCCDLSNAEFKEFNGVNPYIKFGAGWITNAGNTYFHKFLTKDDLSNVNVDIHIAFYDDKSIPIVNFKKAGTLTLDLGMSHVTNTNLTLPFEHIENDLIITVGSANKKYINLSNLKTVGGTFSFTGAMASMIDLSNLSTVGNWFSLMGIGSKGLKLDNLTSVNMSNIQNPKSRAIGKEDREKGLFIQVVCDIKLSLLESVGGLCGFMNYTGLSCPKLKSVSEKLILSTAPNCVQVSFQELNAVPNIKIENMRNLSDFSTFGPLFENGSITNGNWEVTGCAYNPTWQDMKEGRYKPAE